MRKNILTIGLALEVLTSSLPASALVCPSVTAQDIRTGFTPNTFYIYLRNQVKNATQEWDSLPFTFPAGQNINNIRRIEIEKNTTNLKCSCKIIMNNRTIIPVEVRLWKVRDIGPSSTLMEEKIRGVYETFKYKNATYVPLEDPNTGILWYFYKINPHANFGNFERLSSYDNIFNVYIKGKNVQYGGSVTVQTDSGPVNLGLHTVL